MVIICRGFSHFAAGLSCGGCSLGAGYAVGITGDCGTRSLGHEPKNFIGFILIWAWGQLLGLYGLLVALVVAK
jgi:V-type H+-transporting ATPase proteolipid subunit